MRAALVNPSWRFDHSIYFGCRSPHLPLEHGYAKAMLEAAGHEAEIFDGHMFGWSDAETADRVAGFGPDMTAVTTAPTYLFWRCAPPELRVPRAFLDALGGRGGVRVAVGPHGSATPETTLRKLDVDLVVRGECEEVLVTLADGAAPEDTPGLAWRKGDGIGTNGGPQAARFVDHPPLVWPAEWITHHHHHHHRFDEPYHGPGAEVEASRGCPFSCTFCAKIDFRDKYRRRDLTILLKEIDGLIANGARYIYFVDEIFLPNRELLEALRARDIAFGVQTRIDLWKPDMIDLLGEAGCVSIEAGVESLTEAGRDALGKRCKLGNEELEALLVRARRKVPFVQANLIATAEDDPELIAGWRSRLGDHGVWANDPVPLYPYPSSPDYWKLWGAPDENAWERAHEHYLAQFHAFSEIQDDRPLPLEELEATCR